MAEQKSFPVKYMVQPRKIFDGFIVVNTYCSDDSMNVMCRCKYVIDAHRIAKALNNAEGYVYPEYGGQF